MSASLIAKAHLQQFVAYLRERGIKPAGTHERLRIGRAGADLIVRNDCVADAMLALPTAMRPTECLPDVFGLSESSPGYRAGALEGRRMGHTRSVRSFPNVPMKLASPSPMNGRRATLSLPAPSER